MGRIFSLANLLRLRQLQQDQAEAELAAANARLRSASSRHARARAALDTTTSAVGDAATLGALAAARASSRSMLTELQVLAQERAQQVDAATQDYQSARRRSLSLEKLEHKHELDVAAEDLRLEQNTLDELTASVWHRSTRQEGD